MTSILMQTRLKELLRYEPATGRFVWIVKRRGTRGIGSEAGSIKSTGHRQICIDGVLYLAHRLAWLYVTGEWPPGKTDHRNGEGDDNRYRNLRPATTAQNGQNRHKLDRRNTSGRTGINWHARTRKWRARIGVAGASIHIGLFVTKADAIKARRAAEREFFGEFAP